MNCNNFLQGALSAKEMFIILSNAQLIKLHNEGSLGLSQLEKLYSLSEIKQSFNSIRLDNKGYLYIPEHTKQSKILRYLEYGGENIPPTHLISDVVTKVFNSLNMNGGKYVYKF
jgi:hypothetical protein